MGESTVTVERKGRGYEIISKAEVAKIVILFLGVCVSPHPLSFVFIVFIALLFVGVGEKHKNDK